MLEPNVILITAAVIIGGTGIALLFVGVLMALLTALGNQHYITGTAIFLFFPVAFWYAFKHKEQASYALKLLLPGAALVLLFVGLLWWELTRLGLDFIDVMSTTTPKH